MGIQNQIKMFDDNNKNFNKLHNFTQLIEQP